MIEIGTRVIALKSTVGKVVLSYGEGEYIGDKIPVPYPPHWPIGIEMPPNPCIKLDNGTYVWGFMSWWGPVPQVEEHIIGLPIEIVELDFIAIPKEES